jgi:hypothetical protein
MTSTMWPNGSCSIPSAPRISGAQHPAYPSCLPYLNKSSTDYIIEKTGREAPGEVSPALAGLFHYVARSIVLDSRPGPEIRAEASHQYSGPFRPKAQKNLRPLWGFRAGGPALLLTRG